MRQFLKLTKKQCSDSGLAATLILLIIGYFTENTIFFHIAIPVVILVMTAPQIFYPFGVIWLGLTHFIGNVVSRILLTIIYIVLVIPVGLVRRATGKDPLQLKRFRKDNESIFRDRNHQYVSKDLETPY